MESKWNRNVRKIGPTVRYGNTRYIFVIAIPGKKHCTVSEFDANMDINNTQQIDPVNATYYSETAEKLFSRGRLKPLRTGIEFYQKSWKLKESNYLITRLHTESDQETWSK